MSPAFTRVFTPAVAEINPSSVIDGLSNNSLKHSIKHLDEFQKLAPNMTPHGLIKLGASLVKPENVIKKGVYKATRKIGGEEVVARTALNPNNKIRSIHIRR